MLIDKFTQQPGESRVRLVDYSAWLDDGETITNVTAEAELYSGDADDSGNPFSVAGAVIQAGSESFKYTVAGGAHGNTYKVTFTVTTNTPQTREDEMLFVVKEV